QHLRRRLRADTVDHADAKGGRLAVVHEGIVGHGGDVAVAMAVFGRLGYATAGHRLDTMHLEVTFRCVMRGIVVDDDHVDVRRSAATIAATPKANTTRAWPRAYMVARTIDFRPSS